jgi:hypothetical protein
MCEYDAREFIRASLTIMPSFTMPCVEAALATKSVPPPLLLLLAKYSPEAPFLFAVKGTGNRSGLEVR